MDLINILKIQEDGNYTIDLTMHEELEAITKDDIEKFHAYITERYVTENIDFKINNINESSKDIQSEFVMLFVKVLLEEWEESKTNLDLIKKQWNLIKEVKTEETKTEKMAMKEIK